MNENSFDNQHSIELGKNDQSEKKPQQIIKGDGDFPKLIECIRNPIKSRQIEAHGKEQNMK